MKILGNVIKSKSDQRLYRAIRLRNELECLIITDREAKKSAAALSVEVGSLQDPIEAQGLAHYLEHMLFMGTKKYPDENDYSNFITKNFGMSNAYTSQAETNYHFEVSSTAFEETLDRFAQFFICPLMSDSSSERELNAVHSEHSKNLQNDMWRKFQLSKHLAKSGHPFNKFSTGDKNSLAHPSLRQLLHSFYESQYSSNLMKLVVYGDKGLDEMAQLVEEKFSEVPNKKYSRFRMLDPPYASDSFNKIIKIAPVKDRKVLELVWMLPDQSQHYCNPPGQYLSYLAGHEGRGSLLSFLIKEGLAVGLSCSSYDSYNCFTEFSLTISLTKLGVQQVNQVIEHVLHYISMLQQQEPQEWVFREIQAMNCMSFDYQDTMKGMAYASGLVKRLHDHAIEEVLSYPYFMKQWKPQLIKDYLSHLGNSNLMVFLEAKEIEGECNLVEPIYKTNYSIQPITGLAPRPCHVHLPEPNAFIPQNFDICSLGTDEYPHKVEAASSERLSLYFKKDHRFSLPKIVLAWRLYFAGKISPREAVIRNIYFEMMEESLREFCYLGSTAKTHSSVNCGSHYIAEVGVAGFRDSVLKFTRPLFSRIFDFVPEDQSYFLTAKENLKRNFENSFLADPFRQAYATLLMALRENVDVPTADKLSEVDGIAFDEVVQFSHKWKQQLYAESYISGNIEESDAVALANEVQSLMAHKSASLPLQKIDQVRAVCLPPQKTWVIEELLKSTAQQNSAVIVHFQHEATTVRSKVLQDLCVYFVKEPAFDYLRTKQQLGYIVMCMPDDNRGVLGLSILVQSAIKTASQLVQHVDIFLQDILTLKLQQLEESHFQAFKASLRNSKLEKDKNLSAESDRFFSEIARHSYLFNRREVELQELENITLSEFKNFINIIFYISCRRLEVHAVSHRDSCRNAELQRKRLADDPRVRVVASPEVFRRKMSLFPDFYGHL